MDYAITGPGATLLTAWLDAWLTKSETTQWLISDTSSSHKEAAIKKTATRCNFVYELTV